METQNKLKRPIWQTILFWALGITLAPILFVLFVLDRIILTALFWRVAYPIQDYFHDMRLFIGAGYRIGTVFVLTLLNWLVWAYLV